MRATSIATTEKAILRLATLTRSIGQCTKAGFLARVEFVQVAYRFGLVRQLQSYALWDRFEGLGERAFDTCFEMGDSEQVISHVIQDARRHDYLHAIESEIGDAKTFARWCSYADRQGAFAF